MGCSAAKNLAVEPLNGNNVTQLSNGNGEVRKVSITHSVSDIPPLESEDPQVEVLEATVNNVQKAQNGMSFEITFDEDDGGKESPMKKHPPKRFQKLEDEEFSCKITLDEIQEKLDEAEFRRQQILNERIQSAKMRRNSLRKQSSVSIDSNGGNNLLQLPPETKKPLSSFVAH